LTVEEAEALKKIDLFNSFSLSSTVPKNALRVLRASV